MNERLKASIALLPEHPGVYLMKDESGQIIYIGKAKNLKKRVSQYFLRPQEGKVAAMVSRVDDFETIAVKSEKEAFILEMNLIQTHYPRYNIIMTDDSHYPYIALRRSDGYLKIARRTGDRRYLYFGPFPSSRSASETLSLANKVFPTRKCRTLGKKPCLYYHLGQCLAPCLKPLSEEDSNKLFSSVKAFLSGDHSEAKAKIKKDMDLAIEEQRYEDAAELKKSLDALSYTKEAQRVEGREKKDYDVVGYSAREGYFSISILLYRKGMLLGKETLVYPSFSNGDAEEVAERLAEYYLRREVPKEIVTAYPGLEESLPALVDGAEVVVPKEGMLLDQVKMAALNAKEGLDSHFSHARDGDSAELLDELKNLLNLPVYPAHIELFDNSHLQGEEAVAAEVAYLNGEPAKKLYRKFLLSDAVAGDDYHSMKEAVGRRYRRMKENDEKLPDLLLLDGGLTQVHAALEGLSDADVSIPAYGLFKNDRHETEGLIDENGNTYPIDRKSPLFFLLMRMQDEVHRFAISFHRDRRAKAMKKEIYDGIPGLGAKRKERLLSHYQSLEALLSASEKELQQFMPEEAARILFEKLHGQTL